jgi:tRNA A37 threonylcarbamoyladenosine biosynthesis protein TsaE
VEEDITSPTFTLMNVYDVETTDYSLQTTARTVDQSAVVRSPLTVVRKLVHIDTYRLTNAAELIQIGVEDYLGQPETVTVIEWPEKIEGLLKGKRVIKIRLQHGDKDERKIEIENVE